MITASALLAATALAAPESDLAAPLFVAPGGLAAAPTAKPPPKQPSKAPRTTTPHWEDWAEVVPRAGLATVFTTGRQVPRTTTLQAVVGLDAVKGYRWSEAPNWFDETWVGGDFTWGVDASTVGYDLAAGSMIGPDSDLARFQWGPELWLSGYGTSRKTASYYLPASGGVSLPAELRVKAGDLSLILGGAPGWAFGVRRRNHDVPVVDELALGAALEASLRSLDITAGYERTLTVAGTLNAIAAAVSTSI